MKIQRSAVSYQQSAVGAVREPPLQKVDLPLLNPPISPFFKGGLRGTTLATSYLLLATCLGCGLMEKALMNAFAPNPEIKRLEAQKETTKDGIEAVKDPAVDKEKAKQIVRLVESSQRQGHPSLFGAVISGLYTEEGRRLAGIAVVALSSLGVAIWKSGVAYFKGQTILGLGRFIEKEVKPVVGKEVVRSGVGKELGPLDFKFRKILKKKGIS